MTEEEHDPAEDSFLQLVADCDDVLAAGGRPDVPPEAPEGVRPRLERHLGCMRRLRRALQPVTLLDADLPTDNVPEATQAGTRLGRFLLRRELAAALPRSDFGSIRMVLVILALIISGGRRVRHLLLLAEDPLVLRLCGLRRMPTPRSVGRWLAAFRGKHLPALQRVNALVAAKAIAGARVRRLTIDVDGSVVSTGLQVERAQRGFNPHRRKVPSYYPITAYEAQSGQILRVQNRSGNVHDGKAALGFLRGHWVVLFGFPRAMGS